MFSRKPSYFLPYTLAPPPSILSPIHLHTLGVSTACFGPAFFPGLQNLSFQVFLFTLSPGFSFSCFGNGSVLENFFPRVYLVCVSYCVITFRHLSDHHIIQKIISIQRYLAYAQKHSTIACIGAISQPRTRHDCKTNRKS